MNQGKKLLARQKGLLKQEKKRWRTLGKFNQWCKKRTLSQKKKISFLLWLFLVTLPYQIFQLQTYGASWELYWNTDAPYRIGEVVSKKELEEKFIPREHCKEWPFPGYYLKSEYCTGAIQSLKTLRFPYEFLPYPQRVVEIRIYDEGGSLYGIKPGMSMEEVKPIMSKHGWKLVKAYDYNSDQDNYSHYYKGGIEVYIEEIEGKAGGIYFSIYSYLEYMEEKVSRMVGKIIQDKN